MAGLDVGLIGTATATILIDDKNDHSPKFTKKEVAEPVDSDFLAALQRRHCIDFCHLLTFIGSWQRLTMEPLQSAVASEDFIHLLLFKDNILTLRATTRKL